MSDKVKNTSSSGKLCKARFVLSFVPFIALFFPGCVLTVKFSMFTQALTFSLTGLRRILGSGVFALARTLSGSKVIGSTAFSAVAMTCVFTAAIVIALLLVAADILSLVCKKVPSVIMTVLCAIGTIVAGCGTYFTFYLFKLCKESKIFSFSSTFTIVGIFVVFAALLVINIVILKKAPSDGEPQGAPAKGKKCKCLTLIAVAVVTAALLVLGGFYISGYSRTDSQPKQATVAEKPTNAKNKTYVDVSDPTSIIGYFAGCTLQTMDKDKIKLDVKTELSIDNNTISVNERNDKLLAVLKYIKPQMLDELETETLNYATKFGEDHSFCILPVNFTKDDITSARITNGEGNEAAYRFVSIVFPATDYKKAPAQITSSTGLDAIGPVIRHLQDEANGYFSMQSASLNVSSIKITAKIERSTDRIVSMTYTRIYNATSDVCFDDELSGASTHSVSFTLVTKSSFNFTYK